MTMHAIAIIIHIVCGLLTAASVILLFVLLSDAVSDLLSRLGDTCELSDAGYSDHRLTDVHGTAIGSTDDTIRYRVINEQLDEDWGDE